MTDEKTAPPEKPEASDSAQPAPEPPVAEPPQPPAAEPAPAAEAPPEAPAAEPPAPVPERLLLHMPVDVRSASLVVLAVLASVFALQWGQAVFIPLMLSLLLTYALSPLVILLSDVRKLRRVEAD